MIELLIKPVTKLLDKWIPDADTKQKIAHEIATMSERWFQAGWRPATGWVCVAGFAVNFLISPLAAAFGIIIPQADTSVMLPVLMGMLGLGTMRSYEKVKKNG